MTSAPSSEHKTNPIDLFVGRRLRIYRDARGLSQKQLGNKVGLTADAISKYESGKRTIDTPMLWSLATALDVDLVEFFNGMPQAERLPGTQSWIEVTRYSVSAAGRAEQHFDRTSKKVTDPKVHYQICELVGLGATRKTK